MGKSGYCAWETKFPNNFSLIRLIRFGKSVSKGIFVQQNLEIKINPTLFRGGTQSPIFLLSSSFKWVNVVKGNFLTFLKYQKQNFGHYFNSLLASYLLPPWPPKKGGNLKNPLTTKLPKLGLYAKDESCSFKIKQVMAVFVQQGDAKSHCKAEFHAASR